MSTGLCAPEFLVWNPKALIGGVRTVKPAIGTKPRQQANCKEKNAIQGCWGGMPESISSRGPSSYGGIKCGRDSSGHSKRKTNTTEEEDRK